MNKQKIVVAMPRIRRRAWELYNPDLPFHGRRERDQTVYSRRVKHKNRNGMLDS